ncbi:hypothetical protein [Pedobacter psychrodurus]|uniref:hypothetical protein n=1 Tax=Pedobacter psychrodurus TaxID=2530456 RepID=UPI001204E7B1|nr:hypothetical protein [Pedobacter psychrodurus]RZL61400.1 MAG: hypothetical protein EOO93_13295 [Pedobacter sp.]
MKSIIEKWYISLIAVPILLTYLTNYYTLPKLFSDWRITIIFCLTIFCSILLIELRIKREEIKLLNSQPKQSDIKALNRLLKKLDVNAFEEDICNNDAWNGYRQNTVSSIIDYQYASRLSKNEILDSDINLALGRFNFKLEKFTDFMGYHVSGHPAGFLVPFKDSNRDKARIDSDKMNDLSSKAHIEFKALMKLLKEKGIV